jgi:hypothetical protein
VDTSAFAFTLLLVAAPLILGLLAAAWLAGLGVGRIRVVDRTGRVLAEVVLGRGADRG